MPVGIDLKTRRRIDPGEATRWPRGSTKSEPALVGGSITLHDVARPATGHDVLPGVVSSSRPGRDMVERFGRASTVLTLMAIAAKDGAPGDGDSSSIRDPHIPVEPDYRGELQREHLGVPHLVPRNDHGCLLGQYEHHCPPLGNHRERFVAGVEN